MTPETLKLRDALAATLKPYRAQFTDVQPVEGPSRLELDGPTSWRLLVKINDAWEFMGHLFQLGPGEFGFKTSAGERSRGSLKAATVEEALAQLRGFLMHSPHGPQHVSETAVIHLVGDHLDNVNALAADCGAMTIYAVALASAWGRLMAEDVKPDALHEHVVAFFDVAFSHLTAVVKAAADKERVSAQLAHHLAAALAELVQQVKADDKSEKKPVH